MKYFLYLSAISLLLFSSSPSGNKNREEQKEETSKSDWFINQRMFPYTTPDYAAYKNSLQWVRNEKATMRMSGVNPWVYAGPENLGGRVVDVEMPLTSFDTMYVCAASGGIFKTANAGNTWSPIFDGNPSLSIGDLALAQSDASILY
jgi:hypothetical protein